MRNAWVLLALAGVFIYGISASAQGPSSVNEPSSQDASPDPAARDAPPPSEAPLNGIDSAPVATGEPVPANAVPIESLSPPTETSSDEEDKSEVIVTATRRRTSLMKVPIAISEVSGEALENNVIRDTQSLLQLAPSLNIQYSGSETTTTIRIRGIGTGGSNGGFESSVGVFFDGVYLPRPGLALVDLIDIERVEVLRGPQGTLFGKNTTVGAINILTRAPSFTPEADLRLSFGSFNNRIASAIVGGPVINDVLALRFAGQYNVREGYITNTYNGEKYNDRNRYVLRGQALFTPFEDLSLRLIAETIRKNERCCVAPFTQYNPTTAENIRYHGGTVFDPPAEYTVAFDYTDTFGKAGEDSYSAHLDWDFAGLKAKGLLSYGKGFSKDKRDGDFTDVDFAYQPYVDGQTKTTTGEFSLQGTFGILDWLGGVFFSDEDVAVQAQTLIGEAGGSFLLGSPVPPGAQLPLYPAGTGNTVTAQQKGNSVSVFTHDIFRLGYGFDATLGLRYLIEEKNGGGVATSTSPSCAIPLVPGGTVPGDPFSTTNSLRALCDAPAYDEVYKDHRITGTAALGKSFENGLYLYASYSQGFKSGGINLNPPSTVGGTFQFKPETIDNYEAGVRVPLFDNALQARATYFYMDLKNYQLNSYDGTTFTVSNADQVIAKGVEFESDLRVMQGLSLKGNFTYTDSVYGPNTAPVRNNGSTVVPVAGRQLTNSPTWVGQLSANFIAPLPHGMTFFSSLSGRYQSEVNTGVDLNPAKAQKAYALLNGRVGFRFPGDYEIAVLGSNLTDQFYEQIIFDAVTKPPVGTGSTRPGTSTTPGSFNGYPGIPRTIAIELRKRF